MVLLEKISLLLLVHHNNSAIEEIWLHHFRLGHPPFHLVQFLFLTLFSGFNVTIFIANFVNFQNMTVFHFSINNKFSSIPFSLVHYDVWGPSQFPNCSRSRWFVSFIDDCTPTTWVYLLKTNKKLPFRCFARMIPPQFGASLKLSY